MRQVIDGTAVAIDDAALLLLGPSGAGKSDLALRLIDGGARLICGEQMSVPSDFRLVMPADNITRQARVKWRRGNEIGVAFESSTEPALPPKP